MYIGIGTIVVIVIIVLVVLMLRRLQIRRRKSSCRNCCRADGRGPAAHRAPSRLYRTSDFRWRLRALNETQPHSEQLATVALTPSRECDSGAG